MSGNCSSVEEHWQYSALSLIPGDCCGFSFLSVLPSCFSLFNIKKCQASGRGVGTYTCAMYWP